MYIPIPVARSRGQREAINRENKSGDKLQPKINMCYIHRILGNPVNIIAFENAS